MDKYVFGNTIRPGMMLKIFALITMLVGVFSINLAMANPLSDPLDKEKPSPVVLDGKELFRISVRVGAFMPEDRAKMISDRLVKIAQDQSLDTRAPIVSINVRKNHLNSKILSRLC